MFNGSFGEVFLTFPVLMSVFGGLGRGDRPQRMHPYLRDHGHMSVDVQLIIAAVGVGIPQMTVTGTVIRRHGVIPPETAFGGYTARSRQAEYKWNY